jgi:hypothetical protein
MINPKAIQRVRVLLNEVLMDLASKNYVTTAIAAELAKDELNQIVQAPNEPGIPGIIIADDYAAGLTKMVGYFKIMIEERAAENYQLTAAYCDELLEALKC